MASTRDLQLNASMRCVKCMLLMVSFMFAITAVLLVMVGSTIQAIFGDLQQFVDDHFLSPPILLIAIGFMLLFVASLGAYGAIKESVMLINLYGVCLVLVFILEVSASIAALVMRGQVSYMLERTINESMAGYESNDYIQASVDIMQNGLECCGLDGPKDWLKYLNQTSNNNDDGLLVPNSCCDYVSMDSKGRQTCYKRYETGCYARMNFIISQSSMLIGAAAATVAFVQLFGAICAFMLAKSLRRNKSIREARRWQSQQSVGILICSDKMASTMNSPDTDYAQLESVPGTNTPSSPSVIN